MVREIVFTCVTFAVVVCTLLAFPLPLAALLIFLWLTVALRIRAGGI